MKHLFALSLILCLFINVHGQQNTSTLSGTWEIKNFTYGDNPNNNEQNTRLKKFKSFTPTHFTVTEIDPSTNITTTSIFGVYTISGGAYTEKILNVNKESSGMIGLTFSFTIAFEGEDKMLQTGSFNGMKISEVWARVKATDTKQPEKKQPLYIINTAEKQIFLKHDTTSNNPLKIIPQDQIASLEILKGDKAVQLHGEQGRNGVIIITIKKENLDEVMKKLKDQGIIE